MIVSESIYFAAERYMRRDVPQFLVYCLEKAERLK
jgi:hypothetical protein